MPIEREVMDDVIIDAQQLTIDFTIYTSRSVKGLFLNAATGGRVQANAAGHVQIRALDSISLKVRHGERIGLMGHNGCGKTTLLRSLAGVYEATAGSLFVKGSIASLLDISLGMDPELTGRENIRIRGLLVGMKPHEISGKAEEIANFTELGDFLDMPMRTYSSGMLVRIGFAVSTAIEVDLLLMDEWLSVGDSSFQAKASARLHDMVARARCLVIASHSDDLLRSICTRIIRMEHGRIVSDEPVVK
jgi:lipopolysaccharide transport system ATP-binding protein